MSLRLVYQVLGVGLASLGLACGFGESNPNYCEGLNQNNNCHEGDGGIAPKPCSSSAECEAPNAVCDTAGSMTCVQCTPAEDDACSGATPACISNACAACTAHSQCTDSAACLADGTCAEMTQVAYVSPTGAGAACSKAAPCSEISLALGTPRPYVKLTGTTHEQVTVNNRNVTFLADPGAKLTDMSNGILLRIEGTSQVAIYDLEITGASGLMVPGISLQPGNTGALTLVRARVTGNAGAGISVSTGALTVQQSTIMNNDGGGILVAGGTFVIVGNVFFNNGDETLPVGGVAITTGESATNRLEFNSFNLNKAAPGRGTAIDCFAGTFIARNNIMSGNGTMSNMEQVTGTCSHVYSIARPGTPLPHPTNSTADPLFKDTTTGDLHLMPNSPAFGKADPSSSLTGPAEFDIDGQKRRAPADLGADEQP